MTSSVSERQTFLEHRIHKKFQSNCPNTSLNLSLDATPKCKDAVADHDDSGYTGLDSTPRPYRRKIIRNAEPRLNATPLPLYNQSMVKMIHYLVVVVVAASLCFGLLVGDMARERKNMK